MNGSYQKAITSRDVAEWLGMSCKRQTYCNRLWSRDNKIHRDNDYRIIQVSAECERLSEKQSCLSAQFKALRLDIAEAKLSGFLALKCFTDVYNVQDIKIAPLTLCKCAMTDSRTKKCARNSHFGDTSFMLKTFHCDIRSLTSWSVDGKLTCTVNKP